MIKNFYSLNLDTVKKNLENKFTFSKPLYKDRHIVFSDKPFLRKYNESSIIIVAGGGSSKKIDKKLLGRYDYVWSMNHFFRHPVLKNEKVDLAMICPEVDLQELKPYINTFRTEIGFEHTGGVLKKSKKINDFYENDLKFCMHTRVYTVLGYGIRMIIFASCLGVKRIDFIGIDGYGAIKKGNHAFQPGKKKLPTGAGFSNLKQTFQMSYDAFWKYYKDSFPNVCVNNLAGTTNSIHRNMPNYEEKN